MQKNHTSRYFSQMNGFRCGQGLSFHVLSQKISTQSKSSVTISSSGFAPVQLVKVTGVFEPIHTKLSSTLISFAPVHVPQSYFFSQSEMCAKFENLKYRQSQNSASKLRFYYKFMHNLNKKKSKINAQALPSPTFLTSIFSVKSEILPQIYAFFFKDFQLRNEVCDFEISVTIEPGRLSQQLPSST